jgi:CRP/FNR family transcriptional regulator, anaerobic regulatory protein
MDTLLHRLESIHPLSDGLKTYLAKKLKQKQIKKKEYLLNAGNTSRHVCFIHTGLLRCFYVEGDKEVSAWFMKEGDVVFSIESFHTQTPSYESIQALEDTFISYIDYEELQYSYRKFPEFNFNGRVLETHYHILWARQLYYIRMHSAKEMYQLLLKNDPDLLERVPAKYLASYLNIEVTYLSKIKAEYKKRG